jgi:hypothetical protein
MNKCVGVATFSAAPSQTTAPFWALSSDGRPAMMSRYIEAVLAGRDAVDGLQRFRDEIIRDVYSARMGQC